MIVLFYIELVLFVIIISNIAKLLTDYLLTKIK